MFYDSLYYKIIPCIFILINNKTMQGYMEVFNYIKQIILQRISNNTNKIKWKTVTTDFEVALFTSFFKIFNFNKDLNM